MLLSTDFVITQKVSPIVILSTEVCSRGGVGGGGWGVVCLGLFAWDGVCNMSVLVWSEGVGGDFCVLHVCLSVWVSSHGVRFSVSDMSVLVCS